MWEFEWLHIYPCNGSIAWLQPVSKLKSMLVVIQADGTIDRHVLLIPQVAEHEHRQAGAPRTSLTVTI